MASEDDIHEMRRELERIKDRVDQIGHIQAQQVKADGEMLDWLLDFFEGKGGSTRAAIYLAVDGNRGVREIGEAAGVDKGHASRTLKRMEEYGMLGSQIVAGAKVYHRSFLAKELHLHRRLEKLAYNS